MTIANSGYFYHSHLRTLKAMMLSLFSGMCVIRKDQSGNPLDIVKSVPVQWAAKDKAYRRAQFQMFDDGPLQTKGHPIFPKMKLLLVEFSPAPNRIVKSPQTPMSVDSNGNAVTRDPGVPYDFQFELYIAAKSANDAEQLVEQILPHFRMTHVVSIKNMPYTNDEHVDVPITLTGVSADDNYDEPMEDGARIVTYTLSFSLQYNFIGPVGTQTEINDNAAIQIASGVSPGSTTLPPSVRPVVKKTIFDVYAAGADFFYDSTESSLRITSTKTTEDSAQLDLFEKPPTLPRET